MNCIDAPNPQPVARSEQDDVLLLSPMVFLKLQFLMHVGDTEVGGFGLCRSENLLYVDDVVLVPQLSSPVSVDLESGAVADHLKSMAALGHDPDHCARIWIQTRPGSSACPSRANERSFAEACGGCDWSVLFILSRTGRTYARLQFQIGPKTRRVLPVSVDWAAWSQLPAVPRAVSDHPQQEWLSQYLKNVRVESTALVPKSVPAGAPAEDIQVRAARLLPILIPIAPMAVD